MFDFVDETLDEMPFPVQVLVVSALLSFVPSRRDDDLFADGCDGFDKFILVISLISDQCFEDEIPDQALGLCHVVPLPARKDEPQRISQGIDRDMYLGGKAPTRAA